MLTGGSMWVGVMHATKQQTWVPIQEAMLAVQASLARAAVEVGRLHSSYASGLCRSNAKDEGMLTCWASA